MYKYYYRNTVYTIVPCSKKDIPSHVERVLSYWKSTGTDLHKQYKALEECVNTKKSFKIINNTSNKLIGVCYWRPLNNKGIYQINYLFYTSGIALGIMIDYFWKHTDAKYDVFLPHQFTRLRNINWMSEKNVRDFYSKRKYTLIDLHNKSLAKIHKRYFIDKNIKEVISNELCS